MQINAQTMQDLFSTFSAKFRDGMQRGRLPTVADSTLSANMVRFNNLCFKVTSGGESEVHSWLNQVIGFKEWVGDRVASMINVDGVRVVNRFFHETVSIPREKIEDDQVGTYGELIGAMGAEASDDAFPLDLCMDALRFPAKWADNVDFYSAAGRTFGSNTICNDLGGTADLTRANLKTACGYMMGFMGENNLPFNVMPAMVLCGSTAFFKANALYKNENVVESAATTSNDVQGMIPAKFHPRLETNEWYVIGLRGGFMPVCFQERRPIGSLVSLVNPSDPNVFWQRQYVYGCDGRAAAFCPFPFQIVRGYAPAASSTEQVVPGAAAPKKDKKEKAA
jgi:phage major head subunit gpT-like protein